MRLHLATLTGSRLGAAGMQALALILVARAESVSEFGLFSIVFGVQATVFTIGALGLQAFVLREAAVQRFDLVRGAVRLNAVSSAVACIVAAVATVGLRQDAAGAVVVVALAAAFLLEKNSAISQSVLIVRGQMRRVEISVLLTPAILLIVLICSINIAEAVVAYAVGRCAGAAGSWLVVLRASRIGKSSGRAASMRSTLAAVWPLALNVVVTTSTTFDLAIVGGLAGPTQAALYSAANKVIAPLAIGTASASTLLMPHVAAMDVARAGQIRKKLIKLGFVMLLTCGVASLFAPLAVSILFGDRYSGAGLVLAALVWAVPSLTVGPMLETYLQGTGRERFVAAAAVVSSVVAIGGAVAGSVLLGALGAALAVAVLNTAKVIVLTCAPKPRVGVHTFPAFAEPGAGASMSRVQDA